MSKFTTLLTIDVQAVLEMLPKGSHVGEIRLTDSKREVEIHWENDNLRTPFTVPVPYSLTYLSSCELPPNVKDVEVVKKAAPQTLTTPTTETPKSTVDKPKRKR